MTRLGFRTLTSFPCSGTEAPGPRPFPCKMPSWERLVHRPLSTQGSGGAPGSVGGVPLAAVPDRSFWARLRSKLFPYMGSLNLHGNLREDISLRFTNEGSKAKGSHGGGCREHPLGKPIGSERRGSWEVAWRMMPRCEQRTRPASPQSEGRLAAARGWGGRSGEGLPTDTASPLGG